MTILSDFYTSLVNSYMAWNKILINPNFCRKDNEITWDKRISSMMPISSTLLDVINLIEIQQYSLQVQADESIIQLYYRFQNQDSLGEAHLSYYGTTPWGELHSSSEYINWMRIDFDCQCEKPSVIHNLAHMHVSGIPEGRIPFDTVPSPFQFVDFVIANYYPDHYKKTRMNNSGLLHNPSKIERLSRHPIVVSNNDVIPYVIHLSSPKSEPTN